MWQRLHGDGKSTTEGNFRTWVMKTSSSTVSYKVKVVEGGRRVAKEIEFSSEPSFAEIVNKLKE